MKRKEKKKGSFFKGILIYIVLFIPVLLVLWAMTWQYAVCYEAAQPVAVMNDYMETDLLSDMEQHIRETAEDYANEYQSAEEISAVLTEQVLEGEWVYKEDSAASTDEAPVYRLVCNGVVLASAELTPGTPGKINFGLTPWEVTAGAADLSVLAKSVTITAAADSGVRLNNVLLQPSAEDAGQRLYPGFADYDALIAEDLVVYTYGAENLFVPVEFTVEDGFAVVEPEENGVYYAVPACDEVTEQELLEIAEGFVTAYTRYTSHAGTIYEVQGYVHLDSEMYQRMYKALDGMTWVSNVTGTLETVELHDFIYYGNTATVEADYVVDLKHEDDYSGSMHIVLTKGTVGWRVVYMEQY